jgi:hypothetical protein
MPMSFHRIPAAIPLILVVLAGLTAHSAPQGSDGNSGSPAPAKAAAMGARTGLDTLAVRRLYLDGEFESAIKILEEGLKAKRPLSHSDSVFTFKHLGVMYAAKYETREKGRYYMHQLLLTEPTARILDMYASEMIYMIFKNIQSEFESNRAGLASKEPRTEESRVVEPSQGPSGARKEASSREPESVRPAPVHKERGGTRTSASKSSGTKKQNYYWIGATGLLVAAGVGAYFLMADDPGTKKQDHPIDP